MDPDTLLTLFGTDEALAAPRPLVAGPLAAEIANGAVRRLAWRGVEVLRGIDYPIRNADWGTYPVVTDAEDFREAGTGFTYSRSFFVGDGLFDGSFSCAGTPDGTIALSLRLVAQRDVQVNRAGLVVLHPVAGIAGSPLRVTHADGSIENTRFPEFIAPSQPVFDIAALRQDANGVIAEMTFSGETFEMEDQRNWSDASYKTYCRPLSLPYPYDVAAGSVIEQSITIRLSGQGSAKSAGGTLAVTPGNPTGRQLPELALALEPGWETSSAAVIAIDAASTLLRLDLTDADWSASLPRVLAATHGALDLELVVPDEHTLISPALASFRTQLDQWRVAPRSVIALPKAYLKSYQPQAQWPQDATPEQAAAAARETFPTADIGGGMLTNFTELNRYRGAAGAGDFVTHGTTAIVHAADDVSVLQTLEALPQIFASAAALAPARPYRLGLVSIGMRSNPYGAAVAANRDNLRTPMAISDPRLSGLFGAAFMVGIVAATVGSRVERMALAAPAGPLGLVDGDVLRPAYHVFAGLTRLHGRDRLAVSAPTGIAAVAAASPHGQALVLANITPDTRPVDLPRPGHVTLLEAAEPQADWLAASPRSAASSVTLSPFAVAFISFGPHDFFGTSP